MHKLPLYESMQYCARAISKSGGDPEFRARKDRTVYLRKAFMPSPKNAILDALGAPHKYGMNGLGQQVQAQESSILPTMHDTCIAYKLYAECGRMINLLDWCDAFVSVCEGKHGEQVEERKEKGKGKGKEKGKGKRKGKGKAAASTRARRRR